jgi:hypothetical protein
MILGRETETYPEEMNISAASGEMQDLDQARSAASDESNRSKPFVQPADLSQLRYNWTSMS